MKTKIILAVTGFLIGSVISILWLVPHHHHFSRWSIMSSQAPGGPLFQTRTCEGCGLTQVHWANPMGEGTK